MPESRERREEVWCSYKEIVLPPCIKKSFKYGSFDKIVFLVGQVNQKGLTLEQPEWLWGRNGDENRTLIRTHTAKMEAE